MAMVINPKPITATIARDSQSGASLPPEVMPVQVLVEGCGKLR
jgi:hypothetical protein